MNALSLAFRRLRREGLSTSLTVLTLALGIGFVTAIFSFVDALFFDSLPFAAPDELVVLYGLDESNPGYYPFSLPNLEDLERRQATMEAMAVYQWLNLNLGHSTPPEKVSGQVVSARFFHLLGIQPQAGRWFENDDLQSVIIGHRLARRMFSDDPRAAIGEDITLGRRTYTVIGVAAKGFTGLGAMGRVSEFWLPLSTYEDVSRFARYKDVRSARVFGAIARLDDGTSLGVGGEDLRRAIQDLQQEYPDINQGRGIAVRPLKESVLDPNQRVRFVRGGAFIALLGLLLLILVCANVSNLQVLRSAARQKDRAIQMALGAGPKRLVRQTLVEAGILAGFSSILGVAVAWGLQHLIWAQRPPSIMAESFRIDIGSRAVLFAIATGFLSCFMASLMPVAEARRADIASSLKLTPEASRARPRRTGLREILLAAQVAVTLIVLTAAGLFGRNLIAAMAIHAGVATEELALLRYDLRGEVDDQEQGIAFGYGLIDRIETLPGVTSAALGAYPPLNPFGSRKTLDTGNLAGDAAARPVVDVNSVSAGYFATVGIPLISGQVFQRTGDPTGLPVAVINRTMAEKFWPNDAALDRTIWLGPERLEVRIVGVVADSKYQSLGEAPRPYVYLPFAQDYRTRMTLHVRTAQHPAMLLETLRRTVQETAPNLPVTEIETMRARVGDSLWAARLAAIGIAVTGLVCLLVAAVGIYGIVGNNVRRRRREAGIRLAIGGRPFKVAVDIVGRSLRGFGAGLLLGLLIGLVSLRLVRSLLYGLSPLDPVSVGLALSLVLLATLIAVASHTRTIATTNPLLVLRQE